VLILKLLLLLIITNGSPIIARLVFVHRFERPLDFGWKMKDGQPLLGSSKTYRGVIAAIFTATIASMLFSLSWKVGLLIGVWAMIGDLLSSFVKRRLGLAPSSMALGLDQIPESLFPLLAVSSMLGLGWWQVTYLVVLFLLIELGLSRILYKFKIRNRPY
jgi:CDP-2,3-bis-(O-geranylgeranyl)-sn-glycerol synthase